MSKGGLSIAESKKGVQILMRNNIVPFIWGTQGLGKTDSIRQLAKELSIGFVPLYLGTQADMGDILGLLKHNEDGTVSHAVPEWMPTQEQVDKGRFPAKGIVFLDELNRAHPDVLQGMYSFLLDKTIHTHKLAPGWAIVAAGNYENANFNVTSVSDSALLSRFCHIDFKPTVEEFTAFAEDVRGAFSVAAFVRDQPSCVDDTKQSFDFSIVKSDRRAMLDRIAKLENEVMDDSLRYELYKGCVGTAVASAFLTHKTKQEKAISINDVLVRYPAIREKVLEAAKPAGKKESARFDLLNTATSELMVKLEANPALLQGEKLENLKAFIMDLPAELAMKLFEDMQKKTFDGKDAILNNPEYVKEFFKHKKLKAG